MNTWRRAIALAAMLGASAAAEAGEWRPIFDGKSVDGWEMVGPGKLVFEDGLLRTEGGMGLFWYAKEKFGDCVLRIVYKTSKQDDNSGVFIRIADPPKSEWDAVHHGFEVQINDGADEWHRTGAIYSMSKVDSTPGKLGEWNTLEITLEGERVGVALNGVKITSFDPTKDKIPARTKDYEPERGPRPTSGYIGLQNHHEGSRVFFKEVSVKSLK
jgi:hypothetical protein